MVLMVLLVVMELREKPDPRDDLDLMVLMVPRERKVLPAALALKELTVRMEMMVATAPRDLRDLRENLQLDLKETKETRESPGKMVRSESLARMELT